MPLYFKDSYTARSPEEAAYTCIHLIKKYAIMHNSATPGTLERDVTDSLTAINQEIRRRLALPKSAENDNVIIGIIAAKNAASRGFNGNYNSLTVSPDDMTLARAQFQELSRANPVAQTDTPSATTEGSGNTRPVGSGSPAALEKAPHSVKDFMLGDPAIMEGLRSKLGLAPTSTNEEVITSLKSALHRGNADYTASEGNTLTQADITELQQQMKGKGHYVTDTKFDKADGLFGEHSAKALSHMLADTKPENQLAWKANDAPGSNAPASGAAPPPPSDNIGRDATYWDIKPPEVAQIDRTVLAAQQALANKGIPLANGVVHIGSRSLMGLGGGTSDPTQIASVEARLAAHISSILAKGADGKPLMRVVVDNRIMDTDGDHPDLVDKRHTVLGNRSGAKGDKLAVVITSSERGRLRTMTARPAAERLATAPAGGDAPTVGGTRAATPSQDSWGDGQAKPGSAARRAAAP